MRTITRRERVFLLAALAVATCVAYVVFRLRPLKAELDQARHLTEATRARIGAVQWPRVQGDADSLRRQIDDLGTVVGEARATLREVEGRFVSIARPDARVDLSLQISAKASACRVSFRENVDCDPARVREFAQAGGVVAAGGSPAAQLVRFLVLGEPYALPVREVACDASFGGLRALLAALSELPGEVVVLRFDIQVQEDAERGPTPLGTRLLLVY